MVGTGSTASLRLYNATFSIISNRQLDKLP